MMSEKEWNCDLQERLIDQRHKSLCDTIGSCFHAGLNIEYRARSDE